MLPVATGYEWNAAAHRYVDSVTGRFISNVAIRESLENVMDLSALRMNNVTQKLIDGSASLASWQSEMMQQIKLAHTAAGALAQGGFAQMGSSEWGAVGQLIRTQYDYLRNFSQEIADGKQALDGRALVRSDMYGDSANNTYEAMRQRVMIIDGYEEEKYILEDTISACDGCIERAKEGWQPIGTLEPIGSQECMTRDRCDVVYRRMSENGEWEESQ